MPSAPPDTYAQIDLGALAGNLRAIRHHVGGRLVLLPVKANAYGHGLVAVSQAVGRLGLADWLGVAHVAEGVAVRRAGVTLPILKLSGAAPDQLDEAVAHDLRLTIVDQAGCAAAEEAAARHGVVVPVHLKVDTGMRRIGVEPAAAPALAVAIEASPHLALEGIFTHLAVADIPAQRDFTTSQLDRFDAVLRSVEERLGRRPRLVHAANSGAVLDHPRAWGDLVRPGILSYGYYPDPATPRTIPVTPVLSWTSRLSFVKTVAAGETVSYGRTWTAPGTTTIATLPVGYADGYFRALSNRVDVLVGGRRQPQVGRICMDQCLVDLGPGATAEAGQAVTLIGHEGAERIGADDLAALLGTIPNEVLCAIAERVPRLVVEPAA